MARLFGNWFGGERVAELEQRLRAAEQERDGLAQENERLGRENGQLRQQVERLKSELEEARRAAKRQAAPFRRRKRKGRRKRPGRKKGHAAAHRSAPAVVDEEIQVPLEGCPDCSGAVEDIADLEPQVVIDVPPVRPRVRRFHNQSGYCPNCRHRVHSRHPDQCSMANGAAGVQIGPRALALGVDLKHRIGVSYRKIRGVFELFFDLSISASTFARAERRIAGRCEPSYQALVAELRAAAVVNADETGWYIAEAKKKAWLWVFASNEPAVTLFAIRTSRSGQVAKEILGDFQGALGVDGWGGYIGLKCTKGQCVGHLLRRSSELIEVQKGGAARFPHAVQRLLKAGIELKRLAPVLPPVRYAERAARLETQLILVVGGDIQQRANLRFAKHLRNHFDEIFTFLRVPGLDATNNLAEREIRPAVIVRKLSAGNRTAAGAHVHEVLASVSRTAERNGTSLPRLLPALLRSAEPDYRLPLLPAWAGDTHPAQPTVSQENPHGPRTASRPPDRPSGRRQLRRASRRIRPDPRAQAPPPAPRATR